VLFITLQLIPLLAKLNYSHKKKDTQVETLVNYLKEAKKADERKNLGIFITAI